LEVLKKLVGQVQDRDGIRSYLISLDAVAMELAHSEWAERLQAMFIDEFCQHDAKNRKKNGGLCATIGKFLVLSEPDLAKWLDNTIIWLNSNNEAKAIEKALTIMAVAFDKKFSDSMVYKAVPALINMLGGTAPSAYAAAWALLWLSGGFQTSITTEIFYEEETLTQLLKFISQPDSILQP